MQLCRLDMTSDTVRGVQACEIGQGAAFQWAPVTALGTHPCPRFGHSATLVRTPPPTRIALIALALLLRASSALIAVCLIGTLPCPRFGHPTTLLRTPLLCTGALGEVGGAWRVTSCSYYSPCSPCSIAPSHSVSPLCMQVGPDASRLAPITLIARIVPVAPIAPSHSVSNLCRQLDPDASRLSSFLLYYPRA